MNGEPVTKESLIAALKRAAEILDANNVPLRPKFIDLPTPPPAPIVRWRAGVWSVE